MQRDMTLGEALLRMALCVGGVVVLLHFVVKFW